MNASIRRALNTLAVAASMAAGIAAGLLQAATADPLPFRRDTWAMLQSRLTVPTAVVFTTTDCAHCPTAFSRIAAHLRTRRAQASLIGVVMDDATPEMLAGHAHYRETDLLYVFADTPAALRHGVNPDWRGVTPYVALLAPGRPARWITGAPEAAQLDAWLGR